MRCGSQASRPFPVLGARGAGRARRRKLHSHMPGTKLSKPMGLVQPAGPQAAGGRGDALPDSGMGTLRCNGMAWGSINPFPGRAMLRMGGAWLGNTADRQLAARGAARPSCVSLPCFPDCLCLPRCRRSMGPIPHAIHPIPCQSSRCLPMSWLAFHLPPILIKPFPSPVLPPRLSHSRFLSSTSRKPSPA